MSSIVAEANGAQVLPRKPDEERRTVGSWQALQACSADLRATSAAHRELAERLEVRAVSQ